jgi:hypothetical protein
MYVLDIDRFRSSKISEMYERIVRAHKKWGFRKLRAEVTAAQSLIVTQLKEFMRQANIAFTIDEHRPTSNKEERIQLSLEPRYNNQTIWHYKGGNCQTLEEELLMEHPEHDDIKDCLAAVVEIVVPPNKRNAVTAQSNVVYNSRFGGVAYA